MAREYFNAYHSYIEVLEPLNDAERGRLFTACLIYSMTGEAQELRGNERFAFHYMKSQIDRDVKKYNAKCEQNRKNGAFGGKRSQPNATERLPFATKRPPNAPQGEGKGEGEGKGKGKGKGEGKKESASRFVPPTIAEVREYCLERGNSIDPEAFIAFYSSKGWKVGREPMTDWRSAVVTWEKREAKNKPAPDQFGNLRNLEKQFRGQ